MDSLDFGPRRKPTSVDPWWDFQTGAIGWPLGDRNKYYLMRHPEWDYDQVRTFFERRGVRLGSVKYERYEGIASGVVLRPWVVRRMKPIFRRYGSTTALHR